jgi:hypothetical protein
MADWVQKMNDLVQPHVPEPVVAVGILQPAGTWGASGLRMLSPLAGMIKQRSANQAGGGLGKIGFRTKMAVIALTDEKLYAFNGKPKSRSWKIEDQIGAWDRRVLRITTEKGRLSTKVVVDVTSTGDHFELEATTVMGRGFTDAFLTELTKTA